MHKTSNHNKGMHSEFMWQNISSISSTLWLTLFIAIYSLFTATSIFINDLLWLGEKVVQIIDFIELAFGLQVMIFCEYCTKYINSSNNTKQITNEKRLM